MRDLPRLTEAHLSCINAPFSKEEIKADAFGPKPLKFPGPDGIPPIFFQKNWEVVEDELSKGVLAFFAQGRMLRETNRTYITLIPTEERPSQVGGFRPISLCNSMYKVISKCMVNRLKKMMPDLVCETQNAFVPGRLMIDNCFIAHEVINSVKKRKKGGRFEGILKIDLSKAYDRVSWEFILHILSAMGFPDSWLGWIRECISSVSYSVLVNGEPSNTILPSAGSRQGRTFSFLLWKCSRLVFLGWWLVAISKASK